MTFEPAPAPFVCLGPFGRHVESTVGSIEIIDVGVDPARAF